MSSRRGSVERPADMAPVAAVLRIGTIVAVVATGIGFVWSLASASERPPAHSTVLDLIAAGGPDGLVAVGLLALTLVPIGALVAAGWVFATAGERRPLLVTAGVLVLLLGSLVTAMVIGAST